MVFLLYLVIYSAMAYVILDIVRTPRSDVRMLPKLIWILFVVLLGPIGCALWLILGRPRSAIGRGGARSSRRQHPAYGGTSRWNTVASPRSGAGLTRGGPRSRAQSDRPRGPDDDPEFLRELTERISRQDPDDPASRL